MRRSTIPFLSDLYASILLTFRIVFHAIVTFAHFKDFFRWIVASVSSGHQRFSFIRLLCWYRAVSLDSFSFDFYVNIFRSFRILFHWIVRLTSRTP